MLKYDCVALNILLRANPKDGEELAFVTSECLFVSCEALRSKQASEPCAALWTTL